MQCETGLVSITGTADAPSKVGISIEEALLVRRVLETLEQGGEGKGGKKDGQVDS